MTPVKNDDEVGVLMGGYNRRTVQTARGELVQWRIVRAHGSRGRPISYELLILPGAGGVKPELPFIDLVRPQRVPSAAGDTPLLDVPTAVVVVADRIVARPDDEIRASTVRSQIARRQIFWAYDVRSYFARGLSRIVKVRSQIARWSKVRSQIARWKIFWAYDVRSDFARTRMDVDVDSRARDEVRTKDLVRSTHTHTGADAPIESTAPNEPADTPAPFRHPKHAHCGVKFCVPVFLEDQFRQQSGWSHEQLVAQYRRWDAQAIAEKTPIGDALKWLRTRFATAVAASSPPDVATPPPARLPSRSPPGRVWRQPDIAVHRPWHCPHDEECPDFDTCVDRQAAESRARRERSG